MNLCFRFIFLTIYFTAPKAMMMRNDALISRMITNFQKDNIPNVETIPQKNIQKPKNVVSLMQNVLCKNFPSIPCHMIVEDDTLRTLIERSIEQLKYKKMTIEKTTAPPIYHLTLFPTITSEDLSNFLQVRNTDYNSKFIQDITKTNRHKKHLTKINSEDKELKINTNKYKDIQKPSIYQGHKKIRKFYPHKIKYKDKLEKTRVNYKDYSDEKISMSLENPEPNIGRKTLNSNYRSDPENQPVWRIDYMKHGEPSLNLINYELDKLKNKLVKTGPNNVLHPDVFIKRNYIINNGLDMDSDDAIY